MKVADMITIEYTCETIESEPGPNFYWRGVPGDYLKVICDLHILGEVYGEELILNDLPYVKIKDGYLVQASSSKNGNRLVYVNDRKIDIDLDCTIWQQVLAMFLSVSFYQSHNYVEFDEKTLVEHCNFIISSES